jgi:hypothetical protein
MTQALNKYPNLKIPPPSLRRTFYSPIAMDELTRNYWMEEAKKVCPLRLRHYPAIDFAAGCWFGLLLQLLCFLPVLIIGNRRNNDSLRAERKKWVPNKRKLGLLALRGRLGMNSMKAAFQIYCSLESSLGVRNKDRFRFKDKHVIVALMGPGIESLGMTKLYFFLKPIDAESCAVYCRAYKRLLDPGDEKLNAVVDKPTRKAIASLLTSLQVQDVQLELSSPAASGEASTTPLSLSELAEADLTIKPVIKTSLGNLNRLHLYAAIVYYSICAAIVGLIILLFVSMQNYYDTH